MIGKEEADQLRRGKCLNAIKKKKQTSNKNSGREIEIRGW